MVKYQPVFLLCLAYLSHVVSGAAVVNKDQLNNPVRPDNSKVDVPKNLLKRGGGGYKGYGRWDVNEKSQNDGHGYEDYDRNDNEWDHEWYNKFGESSDEQGWNWHEKGWKMDWVNELFNNANNAQDTTTITAIATATVTTTATTTDTATSISISTEFSTTTAPVTSTETETIFNSTSTIFTDSTSTIIPEVTVTTYTELDCTATILT